MCEEVNMTELGKLIAALGHIQSKLSVPKTRAMTIGGRQVPYRNAEDILSAVKPLLAAEGLTLITDCTDLDNGQLKCTVTVFSPSGAHLSSSFSVPVDASGSTSSAQRKGAARSYALKYALCDLFAIDDGVDDDTLTGITPAKPAVAVDKSKAIAEINAAKTMAELYQLGAKYAALRSDPEFNAAGKAAQQRLTAKK